MDKEELIKKIISKKEFSQLPEKDVEMAFEHFDKDRYSDDEKIELTRDLLRKVFSVFTSGKLLNLKNKDEVWILKKHISTRERFSYYEKIYKRLLGDFKWKINIFDLGCGVNGFSYKYFEKKINYFGVEAIGQLANLTNDYFSREKISGKVFHLSLFEIEKVKSLIKKSEEPRVIFLFKTIDSLEMLQRDYSKKLLNEIVPLADKIVVSFATESLVSRRKFNVNRNWILNFIEENFKVADKFELGSEKYIMFEQK